MRRGMDAVNPEERLAGDGWFGALRAVLLPGRCQLCLGKLPPGHEICPACWRDLPWTGSQCRYCALPLASDGVCGRCQRHPPAYDAVRAPFLYRTPVDALLRAFKFQGRLVHVRVLARIMSDHVQASGSRLPDLLVPVPLHPSRLRERGFNQAVELARLIGRALAIPLDTQTCQRIRLTSAQSGLTATERRRNLRNAFYVRPTDLPRSLAIVDDVMTTGATVASMAQALRRQGVERIEVWVCARTPD